MADQKTRVPPPPLTKEQRDNVDRSGSMMRKAPHLQGFPVVGAPRFELGTSSPPD